MQPRRAAPKQSTKSTTELLPLLLPSYCKVKVILNEWQKSSIRFTGELSTLVSVTNQAEDISAVLKDLARDHDFTYHFASPVWKWIDAIQWPHFDPSVTHSSPGNTATQVGSTIDTMLIDVQKILKVAVSSEPQDPIAQDRFLTRGLSQVMKGTQSLNLCGVIAHLQQLLVTLSSAPSHGIPSATGYIIPFLERYLVFMDNQLLNHHYWTNTLFKLTYVYCSIVRRICNDGFCQPPPEGEGQEGEGEESADGVGMGEGTGKENVSEEIKEESQVEGLQDGGEEGNTEREKGGDDDKAIEMSQDIGGELEDVDDQDEGEEDGESGDESEIEDKAEGLDANDPQTVDEKLWGDERGNDPKDSDDKMEKDHSSEQRRGDSEVIAKESHGEHQEGKEGEDQEAITGSDTPEDVPEVDEEQPGAQGAPIEDRIDETETLNLPEDLQMDQDEVQKGDDDDGISDGNEGDIEEETVMEDRFPDQEDDSMSEGATQNDEQDTSQTGQPGETDAENQDSNQRPDLTNPDLHGGADQDYDGMAEASADANKEDDSAREGGQRTRGGETGDNDEERKVQDV